MLAQKKSSRPPRPCTKESWGRGAWQLLHCAAYAYDFGPPRNNAEAMAAFVRSLGPVLPCPTCAADFEDLVERSGAGDPEHSMYRRTGELFLWTVTAHNEVNKKLGKKELAVDTVLRGMTREPGEDLSAARYRAAMAMTVGCLVILLLH